MLIRYPKNAILIDKLIKKEKHEEFCEQLKNSKAETIGVLSADRLLEFIETHDQIINYVSGDKNVYTLKIKKNEIYEFVVDIPPFENTDKYDFSLKGEIWKLFTDFNSIPKELNHIAMNAFSTIMAYRGFDAKSLTIINDILELKFKVLYKLPNIKKENIQEPKFNAEDFVCDEETPEDLYNEFFNNLTFLYSYFEKLFKKD